ncbi:MAG TPA: 3-oxoacyl-[acyl-carrier-protein] synthase III C-terminal domain-containing protein [Streptosporangiaceae bacterium]|nr:3-oxoacyl-[acyl-carrier-protein] synthase III C-terminal domain-containing protein [Streptosporangiaceae bacterium]
MTEIGAVRCALPAHRYRQAELTRHVAKLSRVEPARRALLDRLHGNAGVDTRYTVLPIAEYGDLGGIGPANDRYIELATALGEQAVASALGAAGVAAADVDLLIVTSVTGIAVPSLDARLIPRLGLRPDVKRVPIFGLGCVAGATGLARLHDYLLGWPGHTAVLLAVELCSLTAPVDSSTTPDLVVSGLFGDGAVALVARGGQAAVGSGPRVIATHGEVVPGTEDVLGWRLDTAGFRIALTADLSSVVESHLGAAVSDFLAEHGLKVDDITAWVCHPGGPKVIDAIQDSLGLPPSALDLTRRSLAEVGNMSSASVLHVLQQTMDVGRPPPGSPGLLIGLGPGVSMELVLLEW